MKFLNHEFTKKDTILNVHVVLAYSGTKKLIMTNECEKSQIHRGILHLKNVVFGVYFTGSVTEVK